MQIQIDKEFLKMYFIVILIILHSWKIIYSFIRTSVLKLNNGAIVPVKFISYGLLQLQEKWFSQK